MMQRGMDAQNNGVTQKLMMNHQNAEICPPSYLSGSGIHPCFPPSLQLTVPLSGFRVKPLASAQHTVCVCTWEAVCVCERLFSLPADDGG